MVGGNHAPEWANWLPLAILALVMVLRLRNLNRARRLRAGGLIVLPIVATLLVSAMLWGAPPTPIGWLYLCGGLVVGGLAGWQRARLMRLHLDPQGGWVMMRQSPAALFLLVAIVGLRRIFIPGGAMQFGSRMPAEASLATDALVGFAIAMMVGQRIVLWRRARLLTRARTPEG